MFRCTGTSLDSIGCHWLAHPIVHSCCVQSSLSCCHDDEQWSQCVRSLPRSESGRCCWCLLLPSNWLAAFGPHRAASGHLCRARFFAILRPFWFPSWTLLDILGLLLCFYGLPYGVDRGIIMSPSSKSHLAPYWTTKLTLANTLVQFDLINNQTSKSKVNGPMVHFSYNLLLFGDWWQHDQSKQMIEILKFKKLSTC